MKNDSSIGELMQKTNKPFGSGQVWLIIFLGAIIIGSLWMYILYHIQQDFDRSLDEAKQNTSNLVKAFEEHVRTIMMNADQDLSILKRAYELNDLSSPVIIDFMTNMERDQSRNLMAVYNEQGVVVASFIQDVVGVSRSDREYFSIHRDSASLNLVVGKPIIGLNSGQIVIPMTRRINKPDGSFGGIVFLGLKAEYFRSFYNKIDLGRDQLIALSGMDGFNRVRQVGRNLETGQDVKGSIFWEHIRSGRNEGTFIAQNVVDGINRIVSYRTMTDYPLIVTVGESTQAALVGYEQHKQTNIFGASVASAVVLAFCLLLMKSAAAVQREKERLASLINSINDEVWFSDNEKKFTLANPAATIEFKIDSGETTVENLASSLEVFRPDGSPRPINEAPPLKALSGEIVRNQQEIVRTPANGELRYREVSASPVRDSEGKIIGSVSVVRDITERKQAEEKIINLNSELNANYCRLQQLNATLEEEIAARQAAQDELVALNMKLKEASSAKSEFLANISHELRTPLNGIIGFAKVMKNKAFGPLNSKQDEYMDNVLVSGQHLLSLVNDLLDLNKAEAGKMELERSWINIREICLGCEDFFRHRAANREISLSVVVYDNVDDTAIFADGRRIKQILFNLIDNGIKYNKPGGFLSVTIDRITSSANDSEIRIAVEDTGIGIASENLALLFKPFSQIHRKQTEATEGTGLGLALVKHLVELHGGEISVESEFGKGSRFIVLIPVLEGKI